MTTITTGSPRLNEGPAATPLSATYRSQNHTDEQPNVDEPPREYFTFYRSFRNSISRAPVEVRLALYEAIADYALDLVEPSESDLGPMGMMVWELLLPILRASRRKYEAGRKGGAPKGNKNNLQGRGSRTNQEPTKNQAETNQEPTKNQAETNQEPSNKQITNNNKQETNNNKQITSNKEQTTSNNKEETNNNIQKLNFEDTQERDLERKSGKRFSPPSPLIIDRFRKSDFEENGFSPHLSHQKWSEGECLMPLPEVPPPPSPGWSCLRVGMPPPLLYPPPGG